MADMETRLEWFDGQRQDSFGGLEEIFLGSIIKAGQRLRGQGAGDWLRADALHEDGASKAGDGGAHHAP